METVFITKVKSRYLAMSGSTRDVGGRIFDTNNKNTTSERRIDIPNVTYVKKRRENSILLSNFF